MRVHAAIDLRGGAAVQLVGGRPETERVRLPDPAALARRWSPSFAGLHVVDLDAALGSGSNATAVAAILAATDRPVQVGGGLRDDDAVAATLAGGARRTIVGTRAVDDAAWLERLARRWPGRIVVAADVRDGAVLRRGWTATAAVGFDDLLARLAALPLAAVLVTDVGREGALGGADVDLFARLAAATPHPLIAAGGIATLDDLCRLRDRGVAEAVLGMALYTGAITPEAVRATFTEPLETPAGAGS